MPAARRARAATLAFALPAVLLLGGCAKPSSTQAPQPTSAWREPANYSFVLDSRCGERLLIGKFRVTVAGRTTTKVDALDDAAKTALASNPDASVPTLGLLLAEADRARAAHADVVSVEYDPRDGHPSNISIDPSKRTVDDESCYAISEYGVSAN